MRRNVLALLLAATALAGADVGEFLVDPGVVYAPADQNQLDPATASNDTNSLFVWSDERGGSDVDIYGARFAAEPVWPPVLDEASIVISTAANAQKNAAVASDGTDYLVAWTDLRADSGDIYVCRVTSGGSVLDPEGIPVSSASGYQGEPAIAFDGTNYFVVWNDLRGGNSDIYGARVTQDGVVLDTAGIALVSDSAGQTAPAVAYDGANVLLIWGDTRNDQGDIYCARVSSDGTLLDSAGFVIAAAPGLQHSPEIALGVDEALIVWQDMRGDLYTAVYGSRITRAGEVLDSAGIGIATGNRHRLDTKVTFDGTNYLVVWRDATTPHGIVRGGRVGTDGIVLDTSGFLISGGGDFAGSPAVTFDGMHSVVAWSDVRAGMADHSISAARINGNSVVLDPTGIPVSNAAGPQRLPDAAFGAAEFLVIWGETRSGSRGIYGARLTQEGTVADSVSIRIPPSGGEVAYPSVAYGATDFLVVWEEGAFREEDVRGARVGRNDAVLDTAGILISGRQSDQCAPAVASDGTDFLVAWRDGRNGDSDIYCARVSRTGSLLDTAGIAVCTLDGSQSMSTVAYNGTEYLVLWQDAVGRSLHGARVSSQGVVLDPDGFVVSDGPGVQEQPAAAADGDNFLVVWPDLRNGNREIYGTRVAGTGTVLDTAGIRIGSAPGSYTSVAVEYDGVNFLVVWQDRRTGEQNLYGARVTPEGTILDTFAVSTQPGYQVDAVLASDGGTRMLLAYSGWTGVVGDTPYNSPRIWGTLSPITAMEERPTAAARAPRHSSTIVRGVLVLGAEDSRLNAKYRVELLDVAGRKVLDLRTGPNDVRTLAPGVYFIREEPQAATRKQQAACKIVITR